MVTPEGISGLGREAERLYREYTGAEICPAAALGDALLEGHYVEIKRASSNTLNQVRAVKYITLVAYNPPTGSWYVVPADEVVRLIAGRTRGQHSENPFESATLSLRNLSHCRVASPTELRQATLAAIARSEARPDLRDAMKLTLRECRELVDEVLERVRALL
jgi:hypothetical protein